MKRFARIITGTIRVVLLCTAVWLVVEAIHFQITGNYIMYYDLVLRAAQDAAEEIYVIHDVYNVRNNWLVIHFSVYYIPAIRWIAMITSACDLVKMTVDGKKNSILRILDVISTLIILYVSLIF